MLTSFHLPAFRECARRDGALWSLCFTEDFSCYVPQFLQLSLFGEHVNHPLELVGINVSICIDAWIPSSLRSILGMTTTRVIQRRPRQQSDSQRDR